MAPDRISTRELNRATLARQLLLERSTIDPGDAVAHLAGLQAQTTHSWYTGLWSRLVDFDPVAFGARLESRELVRIAAMRGTIHLLPTGDAASWRALTQPVIERGTRAAFAKHWIDLDLDEVSRRGIEVLTDHPLAFTELGRELQQWWPDRDANALGQLVRMTVPLVQVPPRGVWGRSGAARHTTLEAWSDGPGETITIEDLVRRHLAAFGPASVRDIQTWCGLTRLAEVVDGLDDLRRFTDDAGRELVDLPEAPRPPEDAPAPVRFLYDFDNVLLSFDDRSRMGLHSPEELGWPKDGIPPGCVLIDGMVEATWRATVGTTAMLEVSPVAPLAGRVRSEVEGEAAALLSFLAPGRAHDIRLG